MLFYVTLSWVKPSPWQKSNIFLHTSDTKNIKKRKLETVKTNTNANQNEQSIGCVTNYNRYSILESTNDSMDVADSLTNQHTPKNSPPPPIFVDDVIDIQTMVKSIEKEINNEKYKLKINNNQVKILPANPASYKKITKLLKTLNANFHTYQLKQERPFRVVLCNIHHSTNLDELTFELFKLVNFKLVMK